MFQVFEPWVYVIVIYAIFMLVSTIIGMTVFEDARYDFKDFFIVYPLVLVVGPVIILYSIVRAFDPNVRYYKTMRMARLSKDHKTALEKLGFDVGKNLVAKNNMKFSGAVYRFYSRNITIDEEGYVTVWKRPSRRMRHLLKELRRMPKDTKLENKSMLEFYENQNKRMKQNIEDNNERIGELKQDGA